MRNERAGAAIVLAVVLSLAGVLLAHGALMMARVEVASARVSGRVLQAEHGARAAALDAFGQRPFALTGPGGVDSLAGDGGGVHGVGRVQAISPEIVWVEGEGRAGEARRRGGFLAWQLDPAVTVDGLGAALVTGGSAIVSGAAGIDPTGFLDVPDAQPPTGCAADSIGAGPPTARAWRVADIDSAGAVLGLFDLPGLAARADLQVGGVGTPLPAAFGVECLETPWNWGDPGRSGSPCARRTPLVAAGAGTVVVGGIGQGVLVAAGDLTLRDTHFFGLVVTGGVLSLEGRARLTGGAIAVQGARLEPEARIAASRCWLRAALGLTPVRAPIAVEPVRWIRLDG